MPGPDFSSTGDIESLSPASAEDNCQMRGVGSDEGSPVTGNFVGDPPAASHDEDAAAWGPSLSEDVLHFLDQGGTLGLVLDASQAVEFLQQFTLALCELGRRLRPDFHEQIAFSAALQHRHALVLDTERRPGLRALGNLQNLFAFERGHL